MRFARVHCDWFVAAVADCGQRNEVLPVFREKQLDSSLQTQICFWFTFVSARAKRTESAGLPITIANATSGIKGLACFASNDADGDRRHSPFDCPRLSYRHLLWIHAPLSSQDAIVDRRGLDLSLQQGCSCDCGHAARRGDLGHASDLCCRVPVWLLDTESASSAAGTLSPVPLARLCALASVFTLRVARLLARVCWFALRGYPLSDIYLLPHAIINQPCPDAAKTKREFCHLSSEDLGTPAVCESERAD